jgi:hypothetical protein
MFNPERAVRTHEKAWRDGVAFAAFRLGRIYELGLRGSSSSAPEVRIDSAKAWAWYQMGADASEPDALARFADRDNRDALLAIDAGKRSELLNRAFAEYASAAARAREEGWPDDAWRAWRYRRASLARALARDGMMQRAADTYLASGDAPNPRRRTLLRAIASRFGG